MVGDEELETVDGQRVFGVQAGQCVTPDLGWAEHRSMHRALESVPHGRLVSSQALASGCQQTFAVCVGVRHTTCRSSSLGAASFRRRGDPLDWSVTRSVEPGRRLAVCCVAPRGCQVDARHHRYRGASVPRRTLGTTSSPLAHCSAGMQLRGGGPRSLRGARRAAAARRAVTARAGGPGLARQRPTGSSQRWHAASRQQTALPSGGGASGGGAGTPLGAVKGLGAATAAPHSVRRSAGMRHRSGRPCASRGVRRAAAAQCVVKARWRTRGVARARR